LVLKQKEEEQEKLRLMQEEWNQLQEAQKPDMVIIEEIDSADLSNIGAYNGEMNKMNFNLVKSSKAFVTIEEDDMYDDEYHENVGYETNLNQKISEDGWGMYQ